MASILVSTFTALSLTCYVGLSVPQEPQTEATTQGPGEAPDGEGPYCCSPVQTAEPAHGATCPSGIRLNPADCAANDVPAEIGGATCIDGAPGGCVVEPVVFNFIPKYDCVADFNWFHWFMTGIDSWTCVWQQDGTTSLPQDAPVHCDTHKVPCR